MCQICLRPPVLAFMSHLFCWGRSQGQNHLFKTHSRASLSLVHWQQDVCAQLRRQRLFFKVKLAFDDNRGACERRITKTHSKISCRLEGSGHVFMKGNISAKVKKIYNIWKSHCHKNICRNNLYLHKGRNRVMIVMYLWWITCAALAWVFI